MQFIKIKIQTKNKIRVPRLNLIPQPSPSQAACFPIELKYISGKRRNRPCQNKRSEIAPDRLRCGVDKFTQKSTHSSVTIHFRTWIPYLTLLPTPTPTRENILMQDFPTTLYIYIQSVRKFPATISVTVAEFKPNRKCVGSICQISTVWAL